MTTRNKLY